MTKILNFPKDRIVREVQIIYEPDGETIKKMFVRLPGETDFTQWVSYTDDPFSDDPNDSFWGPWGLFD